MIVLNSLRNGFCKFTNNKSDGGFLFTDQGVSVAV